MPYDETPFEQQLHEDVAARRTTPTAQTIRIGSDAQANADVASPTAPPVSAPLPLDTPLNIAKERTPLPILIAVAMALGAVCVMGGSLVMRRLVPGTKPYFTTNSAAPRGNEIMNPDLVIQNPETETPTPQETPAVEINDLPNSETKPEASPPPANSPAQTHVARDYELTPPGGFALSQSGRRTIWKHENGAQILVETGKAGAGSPRSGWVRLERDLKKRYGSRYKSLGIHEGEFAGQPASIWEFELTGKDGITRRKIDIGIQTNGRGYAILGSAPKENFDAVFPQIRSAIDSFKLKDFGIAQNTPQPTTAPKPETKPETKPEAKPTKQPEDIKELSPIPQPDSEHPTHKLPEPKPTTEHGY